MTDLIERTADQWRDILIACGVDDAVADLHAPAFAAVLVPGAMSMGEEELDDFLGQILHESNMLTSLREGMSYSADRIRVIGFAQPAGSRWRAAAERAERLARKPARLANFVYSNRMGNGPDAGDDEMGDGYRYRGGGHIMGTGRAFFERASDLCGIDLLADPDAIRDPEVALRLSLAWWEGNVPDEFIGDLVRVTKRVNGGAIGIAHRKSITAAAQTALGASYG